MVFSDKDIKNAIQAGIIGIDPYFEKDVINEIAFINNSVYGNFSFSFK